MFPFSLSHAADPAAAAGAAAVAGFLWSDLGRCL